MTRCNVLNAICIQKLIEIEVFDQLINIGQRKFTSRSPLPRPLYWQFRWRAKITSGNQTREGRWIKHAGEEGGDGRVSVCDSQFVVMENENSSWRIPIHSVLPSWINMNKIYHMFGHKTESSMSDPSGAFASSSSARVYWPSLGKSPSGPCRAESKESGFWRAQENVL